MILRHENKHPTIATGDLTRVKKPLLQQGA
jgi:hypothetical protein